MKLEKFNPWNWFKHEQTTPVDAGSSVPIRRSEYMPLSTSRWPDDLMSLHQEMDQLFDSVFRSFGMPRLNSVFDTEKLGWDKNSFRPRTDVLCEDDHYEITLDMPGLTDNDVSVELHDRTLTIRGQREEKHEDEDKDKHYYRMERRIGSFSRTLALPDDAQAEDIQAQMQHGVLKLTIPRQALANDSVKRIPISAQ